MKTKSVLILIFLLIPSVTALLKPGFWGASDDMHIAWLQQMDQIVKDGQIPPRYVPDLSYGFGYPLFNFISPLPYYLGVIFHTVGLSYVYSIKAIFILSLIFSALGMYMLVSYLAGETLGIASSILYIYSPYRATDIYVRGALGESFSFVFLPLIIYCLIKLSESADKYEQKKWVAWGLLTVAGLILTHNIVSYMFLPLALVIGLILLRKQIVSLVLFFGGGLLASLFFWLPAIIDSKLMKYETVFNYFDHFPSIKQLIIPYWGYGASVPGNFDLMSFFIGETNLIILFTAIIYFIFIRKSLNKLINKIFKWSILLLFLSLFMMNFRSSFIWEYVPLIKYFQFPWRFLTIIVFASSVMMIIFKNSRYIKYISILMVITSILTNYQRFRPHDYLDRYDNYYISRYIPVPIPSNDYKNLKEEYLRLPLSNQFRPQKIESKIFPETNEIIKITSLNNLDSKIVINASKSLTLSYNKYNFPGWEIIVDGKKAEIYNGVPYGQIEFKIDSGYHQILIRFRETLRNKIFDLISLVTIIMAIYFIKRKNR